MLQLLFLFPLVVAVAIDYSQLNLPNNFIVRLKDGLDSAKFVEKFQAQVATDHDQEVQVKHTYTIIPAFAATLSKTAYAHLAEDEDVEEIEPDGVVTASSSATP